MDPIFDQVIKVQTFLKAYLIIVCNSLTHEHNLTWKIWSWQWEMPILYTLVKYKDNDVDVGVAVDVYFMLFLMLKFSQGFEAEVKGIHMWREHASREKNYPW